MSESNLGGFNSRISKIREELESWEVDGLLVGSASNRRWLSGFTGSAGWLLITAQKALLGTDSRYWAQAADQAPDYMLVQFRGGFTDALKGFLAQGGVKRIGIEGEQITLSQFDQLKQVDEITWSTLERPLEPMRVVKSEEEIEQIRAAARITDRVMGEVGDLVSVGMSEKALAWELEKRLREEGASGMAFDIIVAAGPNGARAHHSPGNRLLQEGDSLIIDMGADLDGYKSDLTRTFYIGSQPDEKFDQVYQLVLAAEEAALQNMKAGLSGKEIDSLARDVIVEAGQGDAFGHSLGHGVGLDVHEGPRLSQLADDKPIPAGSVVTIEPGVYLPDWGGVRIEDLVLMTDQGIELLSHCPKEPYIPN